MGMGSPYSASTTKDSSIEQPLTSGSESRRHAWCEVHDITVVSPFDHSYSSCWEAFTGNIDIIAPSAILAQLAFESQATSITLAPHRLRNEDEQALRTGQINVDRIRGDRTAG